MALSKEQNQRYPRNWPEIRETIRARAGERCEGSPAYPLCRARNGQKHPVTGSTVVLTVAHLDHTPENNTPENLRCWCQRCHLLYDLNARLRRAPEYQPARTLHVLEHALQMGFNWAGIEPEDIYPDDAIDTLLDGFEAVHEAEGIAAGMWVKGVGIKE